MLLEQILVDKTAVLGLGLGVSSILLGLLGAP